MGQSSLKRRSGFPPLPVPTSAKSSPILVRYIREADIDGCSVKEKVQLEKWVKKAKSLNVLITGKTGAGKSTLVNSLIGRIVAPEGDDFEPKTCEVKEYVHEDSDNGLKITVWDSPGLQDGTGKDDEYLQDMVKKCKQIHLLLYCISLKEERSDLVREESAISKFTNAFGKDIWRNCVFVLTYGNMMQSRLETQTNNDNPSAADQQFKRRISQWTEKIKGALEKEGIRGQLLHKIPVEVAGHYNQPSLAQWDYWLGNLWYRCLKTMKEEAKPVLLQLNQERLTVNNVPEEVFANAESPTAVPIVIKNAGFSVGGTVVASGVSAGVGAGIGALIGGVAIGAATAGIGAGIGAGVGAAAGAGVAVAVGLAVHMWRKHNKKKKYEQAET